MQRNIRVSLSILLSFASLIATPVLAGQSVPVGKQGIESSASKNQEVLKLSVSDAVALAQSRSPLAHQAEARVAGAEAMLKAARSLQNPTISLAHGFGRDTGGLDEDILVTQTFEMGAKRGARVGEARAERDATLSERQVSTSDIVLSVKSAYYEALRSDQDYQLTMDTLSTTRKFADAAKTQYSAGDVAQSNVLRSETELARAQQDLTAAETERNNRYAVLRSIIGLAGDAQLQLTDQLGFTPAEFNLSELQSRAIDNRPDLRVEKSLVDSAEASIRAARAESQPDLFLEGRRSDLGLATGGSSVRVGITMPLLDLGRNRDEINAAKAALAEQEARLDEAIRVARLDVETAFNDFQQSEKLVRSFRTGRLERAEKLLSMAETGYEKGATSYLEVLDAQQVYQAEKADYSRALASYNIAIAALEHAVGGKLE
jgi:cobalt-zinc-cadmium efflux system outer membrane protein